MEYSLLYGIFIIAVGAFASGSFSMPFERVKGWQWENLWLVYSLFAYVITPLAACAVLCPGFITVLQDTKPALLLRIFSLGILYGVCNLTFGLSLKYLGVSLGFIISLGLMMVLGTIIPPFIDGRLSALFMTEGGALLTVGILIGILGVGVSAYSGYRKDRQTDDTNTSSSLDYKKGMLLALFVGFTGASQSLGIEQGNQMASELIAGGTDELFVVLPAVAVLFAGSFLVTLIWCLIVSYKNKTLRFFVSADNNCKVMPNYMYCAFAGVLWFVNMITYGMGKSFMGEFSFTAWGILMSLTIVFATLWGLYRGEWNNVSVNVKRIMYAGLAILIVSSFTIGISNNV